MKIKSPNGMSAAGVGPGIILRTLPFLIAGVLMQYLAPSASRYSDHFPAALTWTGISLIVAGAVVYILAIRQFIRLFPEGKLITTGVYSISRNPVYVSWIIFILPGLSMVCNNWVFLIADLAFLLAFFMNIRKEENKLKEVFGEEYEHYTGRVGRVWTFPGYFREGWR